MPTGANLAARVKTWTVRQGDGDTVGAVLARLRADEKALHDGRVFVGKRRVQRADERVRPGDEVTVATERADAGAGAVVLARTGDLVAVDKPAGIPTIPDHAGGAHSLIARAARALGIDVSRLHPTSRLDSGVSGVVVFTLTRTARERLARARAEGKYHRRYVAIAVGAPTAGRGGWDAPVKGVPARSLYATIARAVAGPAMIAVAPQTGRTHQIRIHAAGAGAPLLGDRTYGGPSRITLASGRVLELRRVALHAARVVVPGETGEPLVISAPVPPELLSLWSALGGDLAAWEGALACTLE